MSYDPIKNLAAVAHVAYMPVVIATGVNSRFKTLADVVAAASAGPDQITYGSPGSGTPRDIVTALNAEVNKLLALPDMPAAIHAQGGET